MTKAKLDREIKKLKNIIRENERIMQKQKCLLESYDIQHKNLISVIVAKNEYIRVLELRIRVLELELSVKKWTPLYFYKHFFNIKRGGK